MPSNMSPKPPIVPETPHTATPAASPEEVALLPSSQQRYDGLATLDPVTLHRRREGVFLLLAGLFLGSLAMLNILGITRFLNLAWFIEGSTEWKYKVAIAIGVLPYPITFLMTDFISELYGRRRASLVVWIGLLLNIWVMAILWVGGVIPGFEPAGEEGTGVFFEVRTLAFGAVTASMIAYLIAQLVDVHVFHFWKRVTRNRHLWLRNNGSTLVSQLVDTTAVILITHFWASALPVLADEPIWPQLMAFIATGYLVKAIAAGFDTIPFYLGAPALARYLRLPPPHETPQPAKT